jgi:hypothetical protein
MLRRVGLVRTDVSEELSASIIRVTRIAELGTMMEALSSSETSARIRVTWRKIPKDGILQISCCLFQQHMCYVLVLIRLKYFIISVCRRAVIKQSLCLMTAMRIKPFSITIKQCGLVNQNAISSSRSSQTMPLMWSKHLRNLPGYQRLCAGSTILSFTNYYHHC